MYATLKLALPNRGYMKSGNYVGYVFDLDVSGQIFEGYVFIHPEVGQIQVGFNFSTKMSINCRVLG